MEIGENEQVEFDFDKAIQKAKAAKTKRELTEIIESSGIKAADTDDEVDVTPAGQLRAAIATTAITRFHTSFASVWPGGKDVWKEAKNELLKLG